MRFLFTIFFITSFSTVFAQSGVKGALQDNEGNTIPFANVALYNSKDSALIKVETTDAAGIFYIKNIEAGNYFLKATFVGFPDFVKNNLVLKNGETKDLELLIFEAQAVDLKTFNVVAERALVVVEPDKTVFNVEGTINSTGTDVISLLRKAPAVTVDNNDNITVLGRSGVLVYIDGKKLPLQGEDLSNYLKNLNSDQIDRIEIITSPGAKYEAQGNAGIIDIRLKKDKTIGANGTISGTYTQGILTRYNTNATGNYRNKKLNVFGTAGFNKNDNFHNIISQNYQNGVFLDQINNTQNNRKIYSYKLGTDFFINKNNTIGFLIGGRKVDGEVIGYNRVAISNQATKEIVDSVLIANNNGVKNKIQNTVNLNYRFSNKAGKSLNLDVDYGKYIKDNSRDQPNRYFNATEDSVLLDVITQFDTPNDIEIYTAKADYEQKVKKGKLGVGGKFSQVNTKNTFKVYDVINLISVLDSTQSNLFDYSESVYAGYVSYSQPLGKKWNFSGGLRAEYTKSVGELTTFITNLEEPTSKREYLNWFPNVGITWKIKEKQSLALNYGRRINRPNYNVLNPFRNQKSELSIQKGNPYLRPEIVNNIELGYTLAYRYNFKLAYSRTDNKITRLIGPDETDPRASFISWDNLATQSVLSLNASLPLEVKKWWNAYVNLSASYIDNQADYGNGAVVDIQVLSYTVYQQHSFTIFKGWKGDISGYYSGPGVWGGVFEYDANWSVGAGIQKDFLKKKLKVKLNANNIFNRVGWKGGSNFDGLKSVGNGRWDSQFISINANYRFGNQNIKSKKRKTGIENESKRLGK